MSDKAANERYLKLERGLYGPLPQLRHITLVAESNFTSVMVKRRSDLDWIVVCKRLGKGGSPEVCFGTGFDLIGALMGLEGALAASRWRPDRPWAPEEPEK